MAEGDPRVHLVMNAVLSALYATVLVWGMSLVDLAAYTPRNVGVATVVIFALTYLVVQR